MASWLVTPHSNVVIVVVQSNNDQHLFEGARLERVGIWSNIMLMIVNCCLQCMVKGDGNEQPQATGSNPIPRKIHNGLRSNGWIRRHY